jgi:xylulose-5-phosphate/fructose-6-phosphate phosphoketolase
VDGHHLEGFWRAHQIPIPDVAKNAEHLKVLEDWMRGYKPEKLFDEEGKLVGELQDLIPAKDRRISGQPITNGAKRTMLALPTFQDYGLAVNPGVTRTRSMANMAKWLRDVVKQNYTTFRLFGPDETESNKLSEV